ncbi:hypothetical protein Tco_0130899 [Tanacetum coccineum]
MKNHQSRPAGSLAIPEANAVNNNDNKNSGSKRGRGNPRGRGRGRGHYGHNRFPNRNYTYHRGGYNGRGRGQRNNTYHAPQVNNFNQKNNEVASRKGKEKEVNHVDQFDNTNTELVASDFFNDLEL